MRWRDAAQLGSVQDLTATPAAHALAMGRLSVEKCASLGRLPLLLMGHGMGAASLMQARQLRLYPTPLCAPDA